MQVLMEPDSIAQNKVNSLTGQIIDKHVQKGLRIYQNDANANLVVSR